MGDKTRVSDRRLLISWYPDTQRLIPKLSVDNAPRYPATMIPQSRWQPNLTFITLANRSILKRPDRNYFHDWESIFLSAVDLNAVQGANLC